MRDSFIYRISSVDQAYVSSGDHSALRHFVDEVEQLFPIIGSHDHNREVFDLPGLDQGERFEQLIEGACAAGHNGERVGVLNQQRLAREEIMHPHAAIEINICRLLGGQLNRASDRAATGLLSAEVCRFHDSRAAASNYSEAKLRHCSAHFSSQLVMWIVRLDPGGAEDGHAWTDEMKRAKSAQEIAHHSQEGEKFGYARTRSFEENFIRRFRRSRCRRTCLGERCDHGLVLALHNPHLTPLAQRERGGSRCRELSWDRVYGSQRPQASLD